MLSTPFSSGFLMFSPRFSGFTRFPFFLRFPPLLGIVETCRSGVVTHPFKTIALGGVLRSMFLAEFLAIFCRFAL